MPREAWTDECLDDLNTKVDHGFARMEARFDRMEARLDDRFDRIDTRFDNVDARFERVDDRIESLHHLLIQGGVLVIAALIGVIATQL